MTRPVYYVAHPLRPTEEEIAAITGSLDPRDRAAAIREALAENLRRAQRWLRWLRRSFPESTFIAPWIAALLSGEDDNDPAAREAGLVDAEAVAAICAGVVLCGGRVSAGMAREQRAAQRSWDLTRWLSEPPPERCAPRYPFADYFDGFEAHRG